MADIQISGLPAQATVAGTDKIATDDSTNTTYKFTVTQLLTYIFTFINSPATASIVTTATQNVAANGIYITNYSGGLLNYSIPAGITANSSFQIIGYSSSGWQLNQSQAAQQIFWGSTQTTMGTSGYLASQKSNDCVTLTCVATNVFIVTQAQGTITVH